MDDDRDAATAAAGVARELVRICALFIDDDEVEKDDEDEVDATAEANADDVVDSNCDDEMGRKMVSGAFVAVVVGDDRGAIVDGTSEHGVQNKEKQVI